jgi:hypothetical protein
VTGERGISFDNWHVSFILPEDWDVNNIQIGFARSYDIELYTFTGPEMLSDHREASPEISFTFHPFKAAPEKNAFLTKPFPVDERRIKIEKTYSPKEIGLDLDSANVYKCIYINGFEYTCYVIRAIYKNAGIEIWMSADSYIFSQVEPQFLETIRSLLFQ